MRRTTSALLVVLVVVGAVAVAGAFGPESVPVAGAVELEGEIPENGPPPSGFFIVPPRVIDVRPSAGDTPARVEDDDEADGLADGADGLDDADDSVDDDDDD